MLNKKTVFNFVYAIGIIGLITTCIGFLNEIMGLVQLMCGIIVENLWGAGWRETVIFCFYLVTFFISAFVATVVILKRFGTLKWKKANLICIICCAVMLVLSLALVYILMRKTSQYPQYLNYRYYTFSYTLRTGAMSFIAYFGIVLGCDIIEKRCNKKQAEEQKDNTEE